MKQPKKGPEFVWLVARELRLSTLQNLRARVLSILDDSRAIVTIPGQTFCIGSEANDAV
jgi:hypothetical protein